MRPLAPLGLVLLVASCQGHLIDPDLPGNNPPPTTNAALAFRFGATGSELIADIASGPGGEIFATGTFTGTSDFDPGTGITALSSLGESDVFLAKYSAAGALVWVSRIGGTGAELVTALARDAAGNLYVGGGFSGAADFDPGPALQGLNSVGGEDGFVAKYSPLGDLLWVRRFGGPANDEVSDLAVEPSGVYAVGVFSAQANLLPSAGPTILSDGAATDGFVLSLDAAGTARWAFPIGGPENDAARGVAVAAAGNVIVAGSFRGTADFSRNAAPNRILSQGSADFFLATYSSGGLLQWARGIGGPGEESVPPGGLALDAQGTASVIGQFSGAVDFDPGPGAALRNSISAGDLFLARYDDAGSFASALNIGGQGTATAVHAFSDVDGSTLLTGWFSGAVDFDPGSGTQTLGSLGQSGATDAFVARYSQSAALVWISRFGESTTVGSRSNSGTALALDPSGNVLVGGRFFGTPDFDPGSGSLRIGSLGEADAFLVLLTAGGALATTP